MNKKLLLVIVILFLILSMPLVIYLVQQRQEIRKKAATPTGTTQAGLSPSSGNFEINEQFSVNLQFNTQGIDVDTIQIILNAYNIEVESIRRYNEGQNTPYFQRQYHLVSL